MAGNPPPNLQQLEETFRQRQGRLLEAFAAWERSVGEEGNNQQRRQVAEEKLQLLNAVLQSSQEPNLANVENDFLGLNDAHLREMHLQRHDYVKARIRTLFLMEIRKANVLDVVDLTTARLARRLVHQYNWNGRFKIRYPDDTSLQVIAQIYTAMQGLEYEH